MKFHFASPCIINSCCRENLIFHRNLHMHISMPRLRMQPSEPIQTMALSRMLQSQLAHPKIEERFEKAVRPFALLLRSYNMVCVCVYVCFCRNEAFVLHSLIYDIEIIWTTDDIIYLYIYIYKVRNFEICWQA